MFVYLAGRLIFGQDWPAGFATTTLLLLMSISMNALFMGVLGEYLGRIFMQSKQRPTPTIEVTLNMPHKQPSQLSLTAAECRRPYPVRPAENASPSSAWALSACRFTSRSPGGSPASASPSPAPGSPHERRAPTHPGNGRPKP